MSWAISAIEGHAAYEFFRCVSRVNVACEERKQREKRLDDYLSLICSRQEAHQS